MAIDEPIPNANVIDDHMAINVGRVLKAAPTLVKQPDLVMAVAISGVDDLEDMAQGVAGLFLMYMVGRMVHEHAQNNPELHKQMIRELQTNHALVGQ